MLGLQRLMRRPALLRRRQSSLRSRVYSTALTFNPTCVSVLHSLLSYSYSSQIVLEALKARIAALEADVVAARQDAAARFTTVRELKSLLKVAREDAQKKDTVIAEQQAQLKASEEDKEAINAELAASNASKARAEAKVATKEDLAVMHAKVSPSAFPRQLSVLNRGVVDYGSAQGQDSAPRESRL